MLPRREGYTDRTPGGGSRPSVGREGCPEREHANQNGDYVNQRGVVSSNPPDPRRHSSWFVQMWILSSAITNWNLLIYLSIASTFNEFASRFLQP